MRSSSFITTGLLLLINSSYGTPSPAELAQLTQMQTILDTIIAQSNLDQSSTAQLTDVINGLATLAENSDQQEINDLQVAANISALLESSTSLLQEDLSITTIPPLLTSFKYSARSNAIQKLIMGACQGKLNNEKYYTNPYMESIGYICNEWLFYALLSAIIPSTPSSSSTVTATTTTTTSTTQLTQTIALRIVSGIIAHCAWLIQKKLLMTSPTVSKRINWLFKKKNSPFSKNH